MLEMKGIDKRFGAVVALNKASLTVENGQIAALAGSNGSGKSTMVKVLAGLVAPNAGEIFIDGDKKIIHSGTDAARENIATAFQDLSLIPTMSVKGNREWWMKRPPGSRSRNCWTGSILTVIRTITSRP